jgi:hypothetical protein
VLELLTGTVGAVGLTLYGAQIDSRTLWGLRFMVGYEYMAFNGFFVRSGIGVTWVWEPAIIPVDKRLGLALTLVHIGKKFW